MRLRTATKCIQIISISRERDKTADFQNRTKQPICKTGQNSRFSKQDKTADFQNRTKQPIFKTGQNSRFLKQDKTADFQNRTKQPIFKTGQNSRFSKQDKTADFQNRTKQPIFKTGQNSRFSKQDKTADFQSRTKQPIFKTGQNSRFSKQDKTADFQNRTKQLILKQYKVQKNKIKFSISPSQLCSHTPSALNAGAKRSGATCHMAMPQCCYLAKGAKRPSHITNMLSIFENRLFCPVLRIGCFVSF